MIGSVLGKLLNMPRLGGCLPGLVLLVIIFGFPVSLAVAGKTTTGHVAQKQESVKVFNYTGTSYNRYNVVVHYLPPGASLADATSRNAMSDSVRLSVAATREQFDRARIGDAIAVRYLPFRPSIGKLADRSFVDLLREVYAIRDIRYGLYLVLALIVAIVLSRRTIENPAARMLRRLVYAACLVTVIVAGWLGYQGPESVPESAVDTDVSARIVGWQRIDRTLFDFSNSQHSSAPLAQPYDVIELAFTPSALGQEVHAADAVDSGTAGPLVIDRPLRIRYASRAPRTARIVCGTRTFRAKNARDMVQQSVIVLAMLLGVVAIGTLFSRKKKKAAV